MRQQLVERHQSAGDQEDIHYNVVEVFTSFMKHGASEQSMLSLQTRHAVSLSLQTRHAVSLSLQRRHAVSLSLQRRHAQSTGCTKEMRAAGLEGQS